MSASQVSGAVQARQSVCKIHPGSPQERQQRVLQAQEQSPAGGVRAQHSIAQPRRAATAALRAPTGGGSEQEGAHTPPPTPKPQPQCPPSAQT